jgi:hypothetical protein
MIQYIGATQNTTTGTSALGITLDNPVGTLPGDLQIAVINAYSLIVDVDAGWTQVGFLNQSSTRKYYFFIREAQATVESHYFGYSTGDGRLGGGLMVYRGGTFTGATFRENGIASLNHYTPEITAGVNDFVGGVLFASGTSPVACAEPSYTEIVNFASSTSGRKSMSIGHKLVTTGGVQAEALFTTNTEVISGTAAFVIAPSLDWVDIATLGAVGTYLDDTVEIGKTYEYSVVAFNDNGDAEPSNTLQITVPDIGYTGSGTAESPIHGATGQAITSVYIITPVTDPENAVGTNYIDQVVDVTIPYVVNENTIYNNIVDSVADVYISLVDISNTLYPVIIDAESEVYVALIDTSSLAYSPVISESSTVIAPFNVNENVSGSIIIESLPVYTGSGQAESPIHGATGVGLASGSLFVSVVDTANIVYAPTLDPSGEVIIQFHPNDNVVPSPVIETPQGLSVSLAVNQSAVYNHLIDAQSPEYLTLVINNNIVYIPSIDTPSAVTVPTTNNGSLITQPSIQSGGANDTIYCDNIYVSDDYAWVTGEGLSVSYVDSYYVEDVYTWTDPGEPQVLPISIYPPHILNSSLIYQAGITSGGLLLIPRTINNSVVYPIEITGTEIIFGSLGYFVNNEGKAAYVGNERVRMLYRGDTLIYELTFVEP